MWLSHELGRPRLDEERIRLALDADPALDADFESRALDDVRVGIVVNEDRLNRLRTAISQ